ncbi:MAG: hypothetical protein ACOCVT_01815 [bacterium]
MRTPVPSIDANAATLGPATRLFYLESDALGRVRYRIDNRKDRKIHFGRDYAERFWGIYDQILTVAFFQPPATRIRALTSYDGEQPLVILLGKSWGRFIDSDGESFDVDDPIAECQKRKMPLHFGEDGHHLVLRFTMNVHYRELFSGEVRRLVNLEATNIMEMYFEIPSGEFVEANIIIRDRHTQRFRRTCAVFDFPLVWPPSEEIHQRGDFSGKTAEIAGEEEDYESLLRTRMRQDALAAVRASQRQRGDTDLEAKLHELPPTQNMSDAELIDLIEAQPDKRVRWFLTERNLRMASPSRTYRLLCNFGDLIAQYAGDWPAEDLEQVFGGQPGSLIVPVAGSWPLDKIFVVAENNPERDILMDWLEERETERLMSMDPSHAVSSTSQAMEWLNLSRDGSASDEKVKRVWRRLLAFLKSDYGRSSEKAIHQKKDEIAKRLQQARDILMKG